MICADFVDLGDPETDSARDSGGETGKETILETCSDRSHDSIVFVSDSSI